MKLIKETKKLKPKQAKWHLDNFRQEYDFLGNCPFDLEKCNKCMFHNRNCSEGAFKFHALINECSPKQSYEKWRQTLQNIVSKGELNGN